MVEVVHTLSPYEQHRALLDEISRAAYERESQKLITSLLLVQAGLSLRLAEHAVNKTEDFAPPVMFLNHRNDISKPNLKLYGEGV